jgi:hypothetical protein
MKALILILFLIISVDCNSKTYKLIRHKDHLFIELTINDKPCLFIIDTGSSYSILDISKSNEFAFKFIEFGQEKYTGIGGSSQMYVVYDLKTSVNIDFMGVNIENLTTYLEKQFDTNLKVCGIIGADFMMQNKVVINFKNNTIRL